MPLSQALVKRRPCTKGTDLFRVKPLTLPDGTVKQPTGKKVRLNIATIARWENGRIVEEYLFWDNADWNGQIRFD